VIEQGSLSVDAGDDEGLVGYLSVLELLGGMESFVTWLTWFDRFLLFVISEEVHQVVTPLK
jgi:hypothetical protein